MCYVVFGILENHEDPGDHGFGIPLVWGLGNRMLDAYVYMVFGAPMFGKLQISFEGSLLSLQYSPESRNTTVLQLHSPLKREAAEIILHPCYSFLDSL